MIFKQALSEGCGGGAGAHTLQRASGAVMRTVWNGGLALAGQMATKKRRSFDHGGQWNGAEIVWKYFGWGGMGSAAAWVRDPPVWENNKNKRPPDFYIRGPSRR